MDSYMANRPERSKDLQKALRGFSKNNFEVQSQVCKIALKLSTDGRPIRKTEKNREIAEIVKGTYLLNFLSIYLIIENIDL